MKGEPIDWTPLIGTIVFAGLTFLGVWLVTNFFWPVVLTAAGVSFLLWLGWPRISWWLGAGRVQRRTRRALRQDTAAYWQARERMEQIARMYWRR